jgi:hypothetical protein
MSWRATRVSMNTSGAWPWTGAKVQGPGSSGPTASPSLCAPLVIKTIRRFQGFSQLCVDVEQVPGLYPSWQLRLRELKGIYVLVDKDAGEQYVGSARGEDSLWGRFADYARTGDGGNVELKHRRGARYQIGLLQVVDTSFPDHRIEEIES